MNIADNLEQSANFFVVDRLEDIIISDGNNIYPAEVENILYTHPAVREVAVFGMPDKIKGEIVKAVVVLRPNLMLREDLIEYCRSKMPKYKVPKQLIFIGELPKTPTGKILKEVLREMP